MRYLRFTDPCGVLNGEVRLNRGDKFNLKTGHASHFSLRPQRHLIFLTDNEILLPPYRSDIGMFSFTEEGTELSRIECVEDKVILTPLVEGFEYTRIKIGSLLLRPLLGDKKYPSKSLNPASQFSVPLSTGRSLHAVRFLDSAGFILTDKSIVDDPMVKMDLRNYFRDWITPQSYRA